MSTSLSVNIRCLRIDTLRSLSFIAITIQLLTKPESYLRSFSAHFSRIHSRKHVSCSKSAVGLLPCCHQADIRMRSHRLLRFDNNKSAASCQQACWKLIVKTFYPQAWCKLFQQVWFSQTCCTWWSQQTCCNLLTTCIKPLKSTTCSKSVPFLAVYGRSFHNMAPLYLILVSSELQFSVTLNSRIQKSYLTPAKYITGIHLDIKVLKNSQDLFLCVTSRDTHTVTNGYLRTQLNERRNNTMVKLETNFRMKQNVLVWKLTV